MAARARATGAAASGALLRRAPIATAIMAAVPRLYAADVDTSSNQAAGPGGLQEIVVTAEKRTENLQDVPISITALGTEKLQDLGVQNFNDYVKYLPSVAYQTSGPGFAKIYMRGVASGDNANHSGPLPSVGVYLDEQPVTTIQGPLDIHVYDIERVEALAGPQGTLYGASSEAGTVRIITNKPDPSGFKAGYDLEGNTLRGQGGYIAEGFANIPISGNAAVRLVGYAEHDGGYIDNIPGTITYPSDGCLSNFTPPAAGCQTSPVQAKRRFNPTDTYGGRAALRVNLNDSWTVTPTFMGQSTRQDGTAFVDPALGGDLSTQRYYPDSISDQWWQAALTVEGHVSNFDITYAGGYLRRNDHTISDYSDYSLLYDKQTTYIAYFESNVAPVAGHTINPSQWINGRDQYRKMSHELRVATPKSNPLRFIGGLFYERQEHYILQDYIIDELPTFQSVTGWPQTFWLTDQIRVDRDYAVFGELSYDLTPNLTGTVGYRFFRYDNSLDGFFGFGLNNPYNSHTGEAATLFDSQGNRIPPNGSGCPRPGILGGPCVDLSSEVEKSGSTPKFNLTYKFDKDHLVYATYSRGFRPGGINRRTQAPPNPPLATYDPDYLTNYELGFKTAWLDNHLRFNGAFFWEDWKNFQFGFLGQNSFTIVRNAGAARIRGAEQQLEWSPALGLDISLGATELDPKLTKDFCLDVDANGLPQPLSTCPASDAAPSGTQLPTVPKFKGNLTARYSFPLANDVTAHVQGAFSYQGATRSELVPFDDSLVGDQPAYGVLDVLAGFAKGNFTAEIFADNALDKRAEVYRFAECTIQLAGNPVCGLKPLAVINTPRTIGIRFGQRF
ncbi:MAG TPA: TonB-dependent receptor [Steroidobacteraceae bacterium]|nr:TonB-dependent receptor [Steroidobacteraceae bacterium]